MTFARVLAGQPRLLLVDHSLDGLPDEALNVILEHLRTLVSGCTVVIASGRSDVIAACDKILNIGADCRVKWSLKALPAYQAASPRLLTRQD
jgi:ABC-type bacteriocin/lantibiotic exporter with double-glycine peptidase domain